MSNIWFTWSDVFNASLQDLWYGFVQFAPKLIIAILFFVVGWILGTLISKAFQEVFKALKVDKLFQSVKLDEFLNRAGMKLNTGYFVGEIIKWFLIIVFLLPSLNLVGMTYISSFLSEEVLGFLPKVLVAVFILIIASIVADALARTVVAGAKSMSLTAANMLGTITRYAIWIFAFIIALGQLGIAAAYMQILFTGIIAMIAIGGALAFGLGGKDHASRFLSKINEQKQRHQ